MPVVKIGNLLFLIEDVAQPERLIVTDLDGNLVTEDTIGDAVEKAEALWALLRTAAIGPDGF